MRDSRRPVHEGPDLRAEQAKAQLKQAPISGIKRTPYEEKKAKAPAPAVVVMADSEIQEAAAPEDVPADEIEN